MLLASDNSSYFSIFPWPIVQSEKMLFPLSPKFYYIFSHLLSIHIHFIAHIMTLSEIVDWLMLYNHVWQEKNQTTSEKLQYTTGDKQLHWGKTALTSYTTKRSECFCHPGESGVLVERERLRWEGKAFFHPPAVVNFHCTEGGQRSMRGNSAVRRKRDPMKRKWT